MEFYTGRHSLHTTPSAKDQNTVSWNIHDLVLIFFFLLPPPFFLFFKRSMYSFLSHSQVIKETPDLYAARVPCSHTQRKCHRCDNQTGRRKIAVNLQKSRADVDSNHLKPHWMIQGFKNIGLYIFIYIRIYDGWVWRSGRRAVERSQACRREGYGRSMDSFPLVQGGPPPTRLCHRCRPAQPTSVHTD